MYLLQKEKLNTVFTINDVALMKRDWDVIRNVLIAIEENSYDEYLEESENDESIE